MTTTSDKYTSNAVALIIGVNDYKAFDSEGKSDLRGSLNDVEAVVDFCTWRLGMDVHNVKALNDPTEAEIFEKIKWLKEELSSGDKQGLLWYSGHGAHTPEEGLLLCPTDTTKDYKNTVAFKELGRRLGTKAAKNLTVVLDCCHGGTKQDAFNRPSTTLGGPILAKELNSSELKIGSVVLTACAVGEQSQQSRFGGKWHGAFTWALLSVASQWQRVRQGENLRLDLTYRELVKKATVLLDALEFKASPQVYPRTAGALSVMQMGETLLSTEITPSANRGGIQLDPSQSEYCKYTLTDMSGTLATVIATNVAHPSDANFKEGHEYWYITRAPSSSSSNGNKVIFNNMTVGGKFWRAFDSTGLTGSRAVTPAAARWSAKSVTIAGSGWIGTTSAGNVVCLLWNKDATPAHPDWYIASTTAPTAKWLMGADRSSLTLTYGTIDSTLTWWKCTNQWSSS